MCRVILRGKYGTCTANTTLQGVKVCKLGLGRASRGKVNTCYSCVVNIKFWIQPEFLILD